MTIKAWWIAIPAFLGWTAGAPASGAVHVTSTFDQPPGDVVGAGEVVTVWLYLQAEGEEGPSTGDGSEAEDGEGPPAAAGGSAQSGAALFGAELELATATADVGIRSVSLSPAFSAGPAGESADTVGIRMVTGIQPLWAIDRSLGTDGAPVLFAAVELQVLTDGPFESGLVVKARGALVGVIPESTVVLGSPSGPDGWAVGQIDIVNTADGAGDQATGEQAAWTIETAEAAIEIRPAGGGAPVTTLDPETEYEIHYLFVPGSLDPLVPAPNGFDLIVTSTAGDGPLLGGEGSALCWNGADVADLPPTDEASERQVVSADLLSAPAPQLEAQSLICTITTGSAGTLMLDLRLYYTDLAERRTVEMLATAEFVVE